MIGLVAVLLAEAGQAVARPAGTTTPASPMIQAQLAPHRAVSDGTLVLRLPRGWHGTTMQSAPGATSVGVLVAANRGLWRNAARCEGNPPKLVPRDIVIHISDYGPAAAMPTWRRVPILRLGRIVPAHDPLNPAAGMTETRARYAGRFVDVVVVFGSPRPSEAAVRAVDRALSTLAARPQS